MDYELLLRFWRLVIGGHDDDFWRLTPNEFYARARMILGTPKKFDRDSLDALMKKFPDKVE